MLKTSSTIALCSLLLTTPVVMAAECPTTGIPVIVAQDGEVVATFHQSNANATFIDDLYLDSPPGTFSNTPIFNNKTSAIGSSVSLGTFTAGTELRFRLHARDPERGRNYNFYTGSESRNPDGKPHARISTLSSVETLVQFEDYPGLQECPNGAGAFTDLSFSFTNVTFHLSADPFLSYRSKPAAIRETITLTDALGNGQPFSVTANKAANLANPAGVAAGAINVPEVSLAGYSVIRAPKRKSTLDVSNAQGRWRLATLKADRVLLPSSTDLTTPPPAPPTLNNLPVADAFACYKTRIISGKKKLNKKLQLRDELNAPGREYRIAQPTRLCAPADQGSGIRNPNTYFMCYAVKPVGGKPKRVSGIYINNERFGTSRIDVLKEEEYCVPSSVSR